MASRYDSFAVFMADVVKETKERVCEDRFENAWNIILKILTDVGWGPFLVLCGILALGAIGFGLAIPAFLLSPAGLVVAALGGGAIMWTLWRNRTLPLAVKEVGNRHKSQWEAAEGDHYRIDMLKREAVDDLYHTLFRS